MTPDPRLHPTPSSRLRDEVSELEVVAVDASAVAFDRTEGRWRRTHWLPLDRWRKAMGGAEVLSCG